MRTLLLFYLFIPSLIICSGCKKHQDNVLVLDACSLITKEEVESVQKAPINGAKSNQRSDGTFRISQCYYTAADFSKSVSLSLIQKDPDQRSARAPKDFWKEKFGRYSSDKENDKGNEEREPRGEEEQSAPPRKISGIGDEAFWAGNRFGGILYVLKGDAFISISLGGTDEEETRIKKSKALAEKALQRW
jgi:hypothetical protein